MNFTSPIMILRLIGAGVALAATWIVIAAVATPSALVLGIVITIALALITFGDRLIPSTTHDAESLVEVPLTRPADLGDTASILSLLDDAVIAYDPSFRITFANTAAAQLFGLTQEALTATIVTPNLAQERPELARLVQVVYPSLAPTVVPRSEHVVDLTFADPELDLRVSTMALGEGSGFLKIIEDRTRQLSVLRSKGEFVTVASHQIRTPLTEISWALETLSGSPTLDADSRSIALQTLDSVKSLIRTAEDLLGVAKIEEGRFGYRFEAQDVVALLDSELSKALPVVQAAGLKLFFDRPAQPLTPVFIDKEKIAMVINNLIENGMRYNTANGEITVKVTPQEDGFIRVSVKDTGIGIAAGDVDKLFTKFFRAENAQRAVAGGTGLGLYIINNIVRAHGGQVGVDSELGRGSTFYFTLATDQRRVPQREVGEDIS